MIFSICIYVNTIEVICSVSHYPPPPPSTLECGNFLSHVFDCVVLSAMLWLLHSHKLCTCRASLLCVCVCEPSMLKLLCRHSHRNHIYVDFLQYVASYASLKWMYVYKKMNKACTSVAFPQCVSLCASSVHLLFLMKNYNFGTCESSFQGESWYGPSCGFACCRQNNI